MKYWIPGSAQSQNSTTNSVCPLFQQIVKVRESLLGGGVDADAEDEILERLPKVSSATELLKRLLESQDLFRIGGLEASDWMELFVHLVKMAPTGVLPQNSQRRVVPAQMRRKSGYGRHEERHLCKSLETRFARQT
jgi:hypothetical protein